MANFGYIWFFSEKFWICLPVIRRIRGLPPSKWKIWGILPIDNLNWGTLGAI